MGRVTRGSPAPLLPGGGVSPKRTSGSFSEGTQLRAAGNDPCPLRVTWDRTTVSLGRRANVSFPYRDTGGRGHVVDLYGKGNSRDS